MNSVHSIKVGVNESAQAAFNLLPVMASLLPVKFSFKDHNGGPHAGEILIREEGRVEHSGNPLASTLSVPRPVVPLAAAELKQMEVKFADEAEVPFPFRGRALTTSVAGAIQPLVPGQNETILATTPLGPVWTVSAKNGVKHFQSSFPLPAIPNEGNLRDVLNGDRFLEVLPLLHFLHWVCADSRYEGPPLRAGFMFDDPNLHWPRYGYVDYRRIADHAVRENYHVSFATVPLDNWFTHPATAEVFRRHPRQLSMLIHGNNHTHRELAQDLPDTERQALLWQAIRRIERLERAAGFEISRVMAAPHGACSEAMMESLPQCGFEAATISHGSLRVHNKGKEWTRLLGYLPSELIRGCPVLPRWRLAANATNTVLLAAYLHQPIILVGHHQDLKHGNELMDQLARFINGLGNVAWGNMGELSRMNYSQRRDGETLRVKPLGLKVSVPLPSGIKRLVIENALPRQSEGWKVTNGTASGWKARMGETLTLSGNPGGPLWVEADARRPAVPQMISVRRSPSALVRRLATEARDRLRSFA